MTAPDTELDRLTARRVTILYRLEMIAQGAQLTYEDGTPIDMASEKRRQEQIVQDMDRRISALERSAG